MKHKHYNEIVAWASGETVQHKLIDGTWKDVDDPNWNAPYWEWRVKPPEPLVLYVNEYERGFGGAYKDKEQPLHNRNAKAYGEYIRTIKLQEVTE